MKLGENKVFYGGIAFILLVVFAILAIGFSGMVEEACHQVGGIDGSTYRIGTFSCEILDKDGNWITAEEYLDKKEAELDQMEDKMEKFKKRYDAFKRKQQFISKHKLMEI